MSRFSGKQYKGAKKNEKDIKRTEAEERAIKFKNSMVYLRKRAPEERLLDAIFGLNHLDSPLDDKNVCMECGADIIPGMDCESAHCKLIRYESDMFLEAEIINDLIDYDGETEELEMTPYGWR